MRQVGKVAQPAASLCSRSEVQVPLHANLSFILLKLKIKKFQTLELAGFEPWWEESKDKQSMPRIPPDQHICFVIKQPKIIYIGLK